MFMVFSVAMKFFKILICLTFLLGFSNGLSYSERKSHLIKILKTDVGHRSSYSYHRHHHHHHHHHHSGESASVEEKEVTKRLMLDALYARSNPRYYNSYPGKKICEIFKDFIEIYFSGAYQPYNQLPYGYNYYTTRNPIFGY